jgi:heterodisulfide reductase subunit B
MGDAPSFTLYTGCLIRARLPYLEKSARAVFERFGIQFSDSEGFSCCPDPIGIRGIDQETWLILGARNLALAARHSRPLMTLCSGCYSTFRHVEQTLAKNPSLLEKVNNKLKVFGYRYSPGFPVEHFARFIIEKIGADKLASQATDSWKGLPVAVHYGCHFLRPSHIMQFDDPENPTKLEELIRVLGAEALDYPQKMLCCGSTIQGIDAEVSLRMAYEKLMLMKAYGAKAIVVICPSCYLQFDLLQRSIEKKFDVSLKLPIFYLTEFVALALGVPPSSLGLYYHRTDTRSVIREIFSEKDLGD